MSASRLFGALLSGSQALNRGDRVGRRQVAVVVAAERDGERGEQDPVEEKIGDAFVSFGI